jgi:hypothetical protein
MESIEDTDLYAIEELLGHGDNLRLLTNDWPGNDPLSNSSDNRVIDDYFYQDTSGSSSNEEYTPSTVDSGNHSPTTTSSSSSDNYHQQYIWQDQQYQQFDDTQDQYILTEDQHFYQHVPPPADLEAIEDLLNDRNATFATYASSPESMESVTSPHGSNNYVFHMQQQSPQTFILPSPPRTVNGSHRTHPYPLILPKSAKPHQSQYEKKHDSDIQVLSYSTPACQPQTFILNSNNLHMVQTAISSQQRPQTIYVPTSSISLTPVPLNENNYLTPSATPLPSLPTPMPRTKTQEDVDFSRKCEDRKIKNRQAAQLSRERKKAEYDQMKSIITKYEHENQELKKENTKLKQKIAELEKFLSIPKESKKNIAKAVGVSLMVVMMFVSFPGSMKNFSVTTIETEPAILRQVRSVPNVSENAIAHIGSRALLAVEDYDPGEDIVTPSSYNPDIKIDPIIPSSSNSSTAGSCPNHFLNATERIRVNNDLISWIDRHEKMNLVQLRSGKSHLIYNSRNILFPQDPIRHQQPTIKTNSTDLVNISNHMKRSERRKHKESGHQKTLRERAWRHIEMINTPVGPKTMKEEEKIGGTELAVPLNIQEQIMKQLAAQLKQKDDMLYVMALKDYFIIPRTATNSTESLKISIVLPALSFNSSQPNHLTMMRIECSVISTSLFFLPDRLVSLFNGSVN